MFIRMPFSFNQSSHQELSKEANLALMKNLSGGWQTEMNNKEGRIIVKLRNRVTQNRIEVTYISQHALDVDESIRITQQAWHLSIIKDQVWDDVPDDSKEYVEKAIINLKAEKEMGSMRGLAGPPRGWVGPFCATVWP